MVQSIGPLPTRNQKAALAGTVGSPSSSNKLVTDQDARPVSGNVPHVVDAALLATDMGSQKTHTNAGAPGPVALTLPVPVIGTRVRFGVAVAQYLRINNFDGTTSINLGSLTGSLGGFVRSNTPGALIELELVTATQWFVMGDTSLWASV